MLAGEKQKLESTRIWWVPLLWWTVWEVRVLPRSEKDSRVGFEFEDWFWICRLVIWILTEFKSRSLHYTFTLSPSAYCRSLRFVCGWFVWRTGRLLALHNKILLTRFFGRLDDQGTLHTPAGIPRLALLILNASNVFCSVPHSVPMCWMKEIHFCFPPKKAFTLDLVFTGWAAEGWLRGS